MKAIIMHVASYLPEYILTNDELAMMYPEWSVDKIYDKTGISARHIIAEEETCSDMAIKAAEKIFEKNNIQRSEIDFILLCTQSPDYKLPTTACIVQNALDIPTTCGALDFNLGCSGYVYGLGLAKGLIETGQANNILLITSELYSRYISDGDKSVRTLFGDGATATLLSGIKSEKDKIGPFVYGSDGSGKDNLIVPHGGSKYPIEHQSSTIFNDNSGNSRALDNLYMNGGEIFIFTIKSVDKVVFDLLEKANVNLDEIDYFVFHQANKFILDKLCKKIGIAPEKFLRSYEYYGNTVSSSIPLGLEKAVLNNKFKAGDKILVVGFGVGYSWAGTIINWN